MQHEKKNKEEELSDRLKASNARADKRDEAELESVYRQHVVRLSSPLVEGIAKRVTVREIHILTNLLDAKMERITDYSSVSNPQYKELELLLEKLSSIHAAIEAKTYAGAS